MLLLLPLSPCLLLLLPSPSPKTHSTPLLTGVSLLSQPLTVARVISDYELLKLKTSCKFFLDFLIALMGILITAILNILLGFLLLFSLGSSLRKLPSDSFSQTSSVPLPLPLVLVSHIPFLVCFPAFALLLLSSMLPKVSTMHTCLWNLETFLWLLIGHLHVDSTDTHTYTVTYPTNTENPQHYSQAESC